MAVFDDNAVVRPENFLETLVGEDKKFKTPEDLARGKWESDNYILSMKEENERLKTELAASKNIEELLAQRLPTDRQVVQPEVHQPAASDTTNLSKEDLAKLIREYNDEDNQARKTAANISEVTSALERLYGSEDKATQVLKQKAQELGVSVTFLQSIAAQSPKAFFAQIGVNVQTAAPLGPTHGEVSTLAFDKGGSKDRTYSWYQNIRKTDPKTYQKLQLQMHEDARKEGFFDT